MSDSTTKRIADGMDALANELAQRIDDLVAGGDMNQSAATGIGGILEGMASTVEALRSSPTPPAPSPAKGEAYLVERDGDTNFFSVWRNGARLATNMLRDHADLLANALNAVASPPPAAVVGEATELERLRAIVATLAVTADGVPVTPGMMLFCPRGHQCGTEGGKVRCWGEGCKSDPYYGENDYYEPAEPHDYEYRECFAARRSAPVAPADGGKVGGT